MIQNSGRPRGRPRQFDEAEALDRATRAFWMRGYDALTIDDLVAAMGVARPSLYAVFGDKAALFLRCLAHYGARLGASAAAALEVPEVHAAIAGLLAHAVDQATRDDGPLGCLLACVAPLVEDPRVRAYLDEANAATLAAIERRLRAGMASGQLPAGFPVAKRARMVLDVSRGLSMRARLGGARRELRLDAAAAAALLIS